MDAVAVGNSDVVGNTVVDDTVAAGDVAVVDNVVLANYC